MTRSWKPSIFEFRDYRAYLDAYARAGRANGRFTFRQFARRAGKGVGFLSNIISGRASLGEGSVDDVARALGLSKLETAYLHQMVRYERTADGPEQATAERALTQAQTEARPYLSDQLGYLYLSRWYYVAVREALGLPHTEPDPVWLAQRLVPPVDAAEVQEALNVLENLDLIADEDGRLTRTPDHVEFTRQETARAAYQAYHREMLRKAIEAVGLPGRLRHVECRSLCVSTSRVAELKERLMALIHEFHDEPADAVPPPDAVYHLHMVLFPLFLSSPEAAR